MDPEVLVKFGANYDDCVGNILLPIIQEPGSEESNHRCPGIQARKQVGDGAGAIVYMNLQSLQASHSEARRSVWFGIDHPGNVSLRSMDALLGKDHVDASWKTIAGLGLLVVRKLYDPGQGTVT